MVSYQAPLRFAVVFEPENLRCLPQALMYNKVKGARGNNIEVAKLAKGASSAWSRIIKHKVTSIHVWRKTTRAGINLSFRHIIFVPIDLSNF